MLYRIVAFSFAASACAQAVLLPPAGYPPASTPSGGVLIADCNQDGNVDFVIGSDLHLGDGSGAYSVSSVRAPVFGNNNFAIGPVGAVDIDLDGDLDLIYPDGLWIQNGGTYVDETAARIGSTLTSGAEFALVCDADNDGDFDLLAIDIQTLPGGYRFLNLDTAWNDGTGNFPTGSSRYLAGGFSVGINGLVCGDFDGDGTIEIAFNAWWADQGSGGSFGGIYSWPSGSAWPGSNVLGTRRPRAVADFDGDGRDDILVGSWSGVEAYLATGQFVSFGATAAIAYPTDFDDDGDIDCILRTSGTTFALAINDGSAAFTTAPLTIPAPPLDEEIAVADVDLDGDPDLVLADPPRVLRNARRHLTAPTTIGLASSLSFDVHAVEPTVMHGGTALVGLALATTTLPLSPFGTLLLDPSAILLLPPATLSNGLGTTSFAIPAASGLVGLELFGQALIQDNGGSLRLSNRTRTVIQ